MANLAVLEKMDGIARKPDSSFMLALKQSIPQGIQLLPAKLMREAITIIKGSDALQKASEFSLFTSIAEVAEAGLSLNVHLGQCFLVPFSGTCTVMYGYRGLCELARRSGEVTDIVGEIRYAKDEWKLRLGSNRELIHIPLDEPVSKRGAILGAYSVAELLHGKPMFEYMSIDQIETIKNAVIKRKRGDKPIPWELTGAMEEMYRKTPIRRLAKRLPQSPSLIPFVQAAIRDEYRQAGHVNHVEVSEVVASAMEDEHIEPGPPLEPAKSTVKEKPKAEQNAAASGPISKQQMDQAYSLVSDLNLESTSIGGALREMGHKGGLAALPCARFQEFVDKLKAKK